VEVAFSLRGGGGGGGGGERAAADPPAPDPEETKLEKALETADRSSVIFGANLGNVQIGNRNTLSANFTAGLRDAAIKKAGSSAAAATESVRLVADALSCAQGVDFVGRASEAYVARGGGAAGAEGGVAADEASPPTFYSMPVKLTFPDKDARIYFEQTVKKHCGLSVKMDLPRNLRMAASDFNRKLREKYPGSIIVVKTETNRRLFTAIAKKDGSPTWDKLDDKLTITPAMLAGVVQPPVEEMNQ